MSTAGVAACMAHTHGLILRSETAPTYNTSGNTSNKLLGLSQTMTQTLTNNLHLSQVQGTTAHVSSSSTSLSSMASSATLVTSNQMSQNAGQVVATNNIINQRADASRSLYQICVNLRVRLANVPGLSEYLEDSDDDNQGEETDPVSSLWRCLRKGTPLLSIYNFVLASEPLRIDENVPVVKRSKTAAFKFIEACLKGNLHIPAGDCFSLQDLFGDDTTGFVKVTQVINKILDKAEERGVLLTSEQDESKPAAMPGTQMSYRDHVVRELVDTERKYVQDLENLHELKIKIEQKGVIPGDLIHDIFLNINAILDFQRRFLIKIETTNSQLEKDQKWGLPFVNYEEAFGIYQPFIANQRKSATIAKREFDKISLADHPVVVDFNTLDGFLLKPMQRLVKYPLLLKDLRDKTNADESTKTDLTFGIEAANRVLKLANEAVDRELRSEALIDLCARVDDWKNHRVENFGDLLLQGNFPVVTGKSDVQKEYTIYLFERILLCCKDMNLNKSKEKLIGGQKDKKDKKDRNKKEPNRVNKLQLKGRIFMTNVTEVLSLAKQGSYNVQIFWKADPGVENFIIRFSNEEIMRKWYEGVDGQRKQYANSTPSNSSAESQQPVFTWNSQAGQPDNPYALQDEDDLDEEYNDAVPAPAPAANSTYPGPPMSLRTRNATGENSQPVAVFNRAPAPRFPVGQISQKSSLSLQTQLSPGPRGGDSYFSPVTESISESPISTRTSLTSSIFPFPRQAAPQNGREEHIRYTAPAIPRAPSRGSQNPGESYQLNGRTPQRPSLPVMSSQSQANAALQRNRSYSTPDINAQNGTRRLPNGAISQVPAVPGIPPHLHHAYDAGIPRSQNNSINGLTIRSNTQSPGTQRERINHSQVQYNRNAANQVPMTPNEARIMSPSLGRPNSVESDMGLPTQLKVKVNCDGNYVTLVVAFNITYQSLIDRIDAKVGRFSNNAISQGTMRLRYRDEDEDFVTIASDDDIQIAFQEWRESQKQQYQQGSLGEIELFCLSVD
ncbi:Rho guanine nucleotide exchange factor scd1 [Golovinomyces cichoracearum]|uniref:Rho guanine nucleotide exchange factor scd1 n=1 Tax=Golovinomyces cichoracearum TaxID=62708 RepID=A0A420I2C9_9PEZI|nr:Rho guanine nucleotide exchange factor scd1 [Golovinomyces cichoracearum]